MCYFVTFVTFAFFLAFFCEKICKTHRVRRIFAANLKTSELTGHYAGNIMGKMVLKQGADVKEVAARLQKKGYIVKQQLPDGSYVIYKKKKAKRCTVPDGIPSA